MNAAETIAAAIQELAQLKEWSTPGAWFRQYGDIVTSRPDPFDLSDEPAPEGVFRSVHAMRDPRGIANAEAVVSLHRTIDAQLAILEDASRAYAGIGSLPPGGAHLIGGIYTYHVDLARAILGEVS